MNVTSQNHNDVSAVLTVTVDKVDYKGKVEKTLMNYAKNAQIPGFRKGKAPLSMIKRQYEEGISYEEINKLVSESLSNHLSENNVQIICEPIPVPIESLDLNADKIDFQFEIGYSPKFDLDFSKYPTDHFTVEAGDKEVNTSVENMRKRFGERKSAEKANDETYIQVEIAPVCEEEGHNHAPKSVVLSIETKEAFELLKSKKTDDEVVVKIADLKEQSELCKQLNLVNETETAHHAEYSIKVSDIYSIDLAELNQELFDRVYGKDEITTEADLNARVKKELDEYFQQNADLHFVNSVLENILEKEEFTLPEEFLMKWIMYTNPNIPNADEAAKVLENEKKPIRFQIIESKIMQESNESIKTEDIIEHAAGVVRNQLMMYGMHQIPDEEVNKYAMELLKNEQQRQQILNELSQVKLKNIILEKGVKNAISISHDEFLEKLKK